MARICVSVAPSGSLTTRPSGVVIVLAAFSGSRGGASGTDRTPVARAVSPMGGAGFDAASCAVTWSIVRPSTPAADATSFCVRSAEFGTASTLSRRPT